MKSASKRRSTILALGILFLMGGSVLAGLPKKEFKRLTSEAAGHLKNENYSALGDTLQALAKDDSSKAVKLIAKILSRCHGDGTAFAGARTGVMDMTNKSAIKEQRKQAHSAKDWHARAMFLEACGARAQPDDIKALTKGVKDKNAVVATNAIRKLCALRVEGAIEPMIALMEKLDSSRQPPWSELKYSLGLLFAKKLSAGADFRSWWSVIQSKGGLKSVTEAEREKYIGEESADSGGAKAGTAVRIFGAEIECSRIVFVLDVSGSMKSIDPSDGVVTGPVGSVPQGGANAKPKEDPRMRIARAKNELKRVVKALPASIQINIIAYSSGVTIWKEKGLVKLNAKNKTGAMSFIDKLEAFGVTQTDTALSRSFKVDGARCVYLLSDGKPSRGQGDDIDPNDIYQQVERENKLLKIRIFTLGFRGADTTFMRELAKKTGGKYSNIK
jgi:hypothetical protein